MSILGVKWVSRGRIMVGKEGICQHLWTYKILRISLCCISSHTWSQTGLISDFFHKSFTMMIVISHITRITFTSVLNSALSPTHSLCLLLKAVPIWSGTAALMTIAPTWIWTYQDSGTNYEVSNMWPEHSHTSDSVSRILRGIYTVSVVMKGQECYKNGPFSLKAETELRRSLIQDWYSAVSGKWLTALQLYRQC